MSDLGRYNGVVVDGDGVGFFSAFLCDRFNKVDAVEQSQAAAPYFQRNVPNTNASFHLVSIERWCKASARGPHDFVLVDPPRAGLTKVARKVILALGSQNMVYVSCNPTTMARAAVAAYRMGYEDLYYWMAKNRFKWDSRAGVWRDMRRDY